jgi:hypothetical protein
MIKSNKFKPRVFPIGGSGTDAEINRAQSMTPDVTLNREKVNELGRVGAVGFINKPPTIGYSLTQLEYGNIEFYRKITNQEAKGGVGQSAITLQDFNRPYFDIAAYLTDDDGIYRGTLLYPSLRVSGFSVSIGEPTGNIERSFDLVGEAASILQGDNKYYVAKVATPSAGEDKNIVLDYTATKDPDNDVYMLRVVRVSSAGVVTELIKDTDYTETDADNVSIAVVNASDTIKLYYTSSDATIDPEDYFTPTGNEEVVAIAGDSADIFLYVPSSGKPSADDKIYRLQSCTLEISLDREDLFEIGNSKVVQRGVKSSTVTVSIGRILESFTVEEVLRGEVEGYGIIDVTKLTDSATLTLKIYSDNTKETLKYGLRADGLSVASIGGDASVEEYTNKDNSLEGESLIISADNDVLDAE